MTNWTKRKACCINNRCFCAAYRFMAPLGLWVSLMPIVLAVIEGIAGETSGVTFALYNYLEREAGSGATGVALTVLMDAAFMAASSIVSKRGSAAPWQRRKMTGLLETHVACWPCATPGCFQRMKAAIFAKSISWLPVQRALQLFYYYAVAIHHNGRVLDCHRRITADPSAFWLPRDTQVSERYMKTCCYNAKQFLGLEGETRRVQITQLRGKQ